MAMAFQKVNLPVCYGRSRGKDNAQFLPQAQAVRTPRAYYTAASPALPAVPGCCRTRPPRRCSRWQEWCHPRTGLPPVLADSLALVEALCDAEVLADSDALVEALMEALVLADSLALVEALIDRKSVV